MTALITFLKMRKKITKNCRFSKYYNVELHKDTASESKAVSSQLHPRLNKYKPNKPNNTWKVLEAPPQLNRRQRLTLLSFSRISNVPSFHLVVPRSMLVKRILIAPPLESLGTMVAMAYYPVGALWRMGLVNEQILNKRNSINCVKTTTAMSSLHRVDYNDYSLTVSVCLNTTTY